MLILRVSNSNLFYRSLVESKDELEYKHEVNDGLVSPNTPTQATAAKRPFPRYKELDLTRLDGRGHHPEKVPLSGGVHQKKAPTKQCVVCYARGRRRESSYICKTCESKPALCVVPCFEIFHTLSDISA